MDKPKHTDTPYEPLPDLPDYDPEPADGVRVGESPVPGLTLKRILRGHTDCIARIAWSPDGRFLASPSFDKTIRIWDVARGECTAVFEGHEDQVNSVAWSPDGRRLASGSGDRTIRVWNTETRRALAILKGHKGGVYSVAWSPDGRRLASGSDDKTIRIWDTETWETLSVLRGHEEMINSLSWSPDGHRLASASDDDTVKIWNPTTSVEDFILSGHSSYVVSIAWSPNHSLIASGAFDNSIRLWNVRSGRPYQILEGHTDGIQQLSFSIDGALLASKARQADSTVRLWRSDTWNTVAQFNETTTDNFTSSLAFHPYLPRLATLGERDRVIRIWDLDMDVLLGQTATDFVRYTTAKLVLVGDSGVGKTGLGWRLAHGEFKEHASSHGQQFWVIDDLCTTRADGTECEAVLWDLAGQHVYRPIHAIFLDDVDASLVLFDPTNRQDPLKGVEFWLEQLAGKKELPPSVLVGARLDRGAPVLSQQELDQFCQRHGIDGGYIGTSAKSGDGLDRLLEALKTQIPWEQMTTTVTTRTFKRVKEYVLSLKEQPGRENVLVSPAELRQQLQASDPEWEFSDAEMMTAVGHLATHGYVAILHSSSGEQTILLTPDLLVDLASSIVLQADKHPRELGALSETTLLQGGYSFPELADLDRAEREILLDAAVLRFVEHNICFRETLGAETLLIFPGLIKQKRPIVDEFEAVDDVSYVARGRVENVYPALVVLLGYTRAFTRINQWQRQAQYEMGEGQICGFRLIEEREGEIELVLYYSAAMPEFGRKMFQGLFEQFLYQRDVEVTRYLPVACPDGHLQERATVVKRIREGKQFLFCEECGQKITLPEIEKPAPDVPDAPWIQREEALARLRSTYETHLVRVKGFRRDRAAPRCYISHLPEEATWVAQLAHDLRDAGVYVVQEREQIETDDFVVTVDTPLYQQSYQRKAQSIAADVALIRARLKQGKKSTVIPLSGTGDFQQKTRYALSLFDLVLSLYAIPRNHPAFEPLRRSLHQRWEETLSKLPPEGKSTMKPLKVFISYAHEDEVFKDELVVMLASMQRRGIIDAWQDRRIEAGDEWYQAIQEAMNECDLALLLVSKYFLASRFIQDEEVPHLLQRRKKEGMRVIPIIIRPCTWSSEPVLKDLQALPQDGKAVITFPENTGARDQVWTEIAKVIERQTKALQSAV